MKAAASVSGRAVVRSRQIVQRMIMSHISNYLGSVLWGMRLIEDEAYSCMQLPTLRDYQYLLSTLEEDGELSTSSDNVEDTFFLIPVPNRYIKRETDGKQKWVHRPEDEGKADVPSLVYLVVRKDFDKGGPKRFKSRDMEKFLTEVRALAALILIKEVIDIAVKDEKREGKSYKDYLKDSKLSQKNIEKTMRRNKNMGEKMSTVSSNKVSPKYFIQEEFFKKNRKNYDKTLERLRKIGLSL